MGWWESGNVGKRAVEVEWVTEVRGGDEGGRVQERRGCRRGEGL